MATKPSSSRALHIKRTKLKLASLHKDQGKLPFEYPFVTCCMHVLYLLLVKWPHEGFFCPFFRGAGAVKQHAFARVNQ